MIRDGRTVLDVEQLASLRELNEPGRPDVVTELIDMFFVHAAETLEGLRTEIAKPQKDSKKIEKLAHKLKGSCANLGAIHLRSLCQVLEEESRVGVLVEPENRLLSIEVAFLEVCDALKRDWWQGAA